MREVQKIKELALANGFSLKEQASGNMDLHSYVYEFANAIEQAVKAQAVPEGYKVVPVNYECVWCGCTELDGWADETMIEAQEPTND